MPGRPLVCMLQLTRGQIWSWNTYQLLESSVAVAVHILNLPSASALASPLLLHNSRSKSRSQPIGTPLHPPLLAASVRGNHASFDLDFDRTAQAIYKVDPQLLEVRDHLDYRWQQYKATKEAIEKGAGGLKQFAKVRGSSM